MAPGTEKLFLVRRDIFACQKGPTHCHHFEYPILGTGASQRGLVPSSEVNIMGFIGLAKGDDCLHGRRCPPKVGKADKPAAPIAQYNDGRQHKAVFGTDGSSKEAAGARLTVRSTNSGLSSWRFCRHQCFWLLEELQIWKLKHNAKYLKHHTSFNALKSLISGSVK